MLLYPFIGLDSECIPDHAMAWNDADFWLVPVRVRQQDDLASIIPDLEESVQLPGI
jgi:hypothetical protein